MGKGNKMFRQNVDLSNEKDPQVMQAIQLLWLSPSNKKDIANQTKLNLGQIHKIYQLHFVNKHINPSKMPPPKSLLTFKPIVEEKPVEEVKEPEKPEKVEEPEIIVEEKEEVTTTVSELDDPVKDQPTKKGKGGRASLDENLILAICTDVENGMSYIDAAKKYKCSDASVRKYCKQMGIETTWKRGGKKKDSNKPVEVKEVVVEKEKPKFIRATNTSYIRAMLINGRHEMPISKYIFESVDNEKLFDYKWYDTTVREWIIKNIPKINGVWQKTLDCYVTGLPAASIAVTKICEELGVNLVFSHYNTDQDRYIKQVIFDKFPVATHTENDPDVLGKFFENVDVYVLDNTTIGELASLPFWYCISMRKIVKRRAKTNIRHYLVKEYDDISLYIMDLIKEIRNLQEPYVIEVNSVERGEKGDFIYKERILSAYNHAVADKEIHNK